MDIQEWGSQRLASFDLPLKPNALDATFAVAANLAGIGLTPYLGEEANTGAFLGALFATFPWAVGVFGTGGLLPLSWAGYKKGGQQKDSESVTGADFTLVVHLPGGRVRIAVFQAKRVQNMVVSDAQLKFTSPRLSMPYQVTKASFPSIKLHHLVGRDKDKWQFTQLRDHGHGVIGIALSSGQRLSTLNKAFDWIHYVAYEQGQPWCVSMSRLNKFDRWYKRNEHTSLVYPKGSVDETSFHALLLQGSIPHDKMANGWLTLDEDAATQALPQFLPIGPVYVTDAIAGGPVPDFFPGIKPFVRTRTQPPAAPAPTPNPKSSPVSPVQAVTPVRRSGPGRGRP